MTGQDLPTYIATDNQFKPVYGYLRPKPQADIKQSPWARTYGDDIYVFKKSHVRDRLTWTSGDSFAPAEYAPTTPDGKPQNWRGFFIPWKDRMLMGPDVLGRVEESDTEFEGGIPPFRFGAVKPTAVGAPKMPSSLPPPTPPTPDLPPLPEAPAPPTLARPPEPPRSPRSPQLKAPLLPPLQAGEKFDDALARYQATDEFKAYQAEFQKAGPGVRTKTGGI